MALAAVLLGGSFLFATESPVPATVLPLLQTISDEAVPHELTINGFPMDGLGSVRAHARAVYGFATPLERYTCVPPYALQASGNRLRAHYHLDLSSMVADDQGPWLLDVCIATLRYSPPAAARGERTFTEKDLARLTTPPLPKTTASAAAHAQEVIFAWKAPLPVWGWTHGVPIPDTPETVAGLYQAYVRLHQDLHALASAHDRLGAAEAFARQMRSTMSDFITASQLRGKPYTVVEELAYAGAIQALGITTRAQARECLQEAARPVPPVRLEDLHDPAFPVQDGPSRPLYDPTPDGLPPPHLILCALPQPSAVTMELMGNGTLARLISDGRGLIAFASQWRDGPWGMQGTLKIDADVWFRRTAEGQWVVDAIWREVSSMEANESLDELLARLPW